MSPSFPNQSRYPPHHVSDSHPALSQLGLVTFAATSAISPNTPTTLAAVAAAVVVAIAFVAVAEEDVASLLLYAFRE